MTVKEVLKMQFQFYFISIVIRQTIFQLHVYISISKPTEIKSNLFLNKKLQICYKDLFTVLLEKCINNNCLHLICLRGGSEFGVRS